MRGNRIDSPTPATDPDQDKPTDVAGIMAANNRIKVSSSPWQLLTLCCRGEQLPWQCIVIFSCKAIESVIYE